MDCWKEMEFADGGDNDWNDIEARLYSEVFHGTAEDDVKNDILEKSNDVLLLNNTKKCRYFRSGDKSNSESPFHITIDSKNCRQKETPTAGNNFTVLTTFNSKPSDSSESHQNITVNQYTIPVIINAENCLHSCHSWSLNKGVNCNDNRISNNEKNGSIDSTRLFVRKLKNHSKRKKNKNHTKEIVRRQSLQEKNTKIIFISDESEDYEADEIQQIHDKITTNYNEESENDIIYIAPPPVEIVNVEEEEDQLVLIEKSKTECTKSNEAKHNAENEKKNNETDANRLHTSESLNDFLEQRAENGTNRFNGLFDTEFNSNAEFIPPSIPIEYSETESSCSTNDQNKDINHTIVFDEIEFPREDIFSDKNLDSFGTFITPRRFSEKSGISLSSKIKKIGLDITGSHDSSNSSTESDYESIEKTKSGKENLPTLSSMVVNKNSCEIGKSPIQKRSSKNILDLRILKTFSEETQLENIAKRKKLKKYPKKKIQDNAIEIKKNVESYFDDLETPNITNPTNLMVEDDITANLNNTEIDNIENTSRIIKKKNKKNKSKKTKPTTHKSRIGDTLVSILNVDAANDEDLNEDICSNKTAVIADSRKDHSTEETVVISDPNDICLFDESIKDMNTSLEFERKIKNVGTVGEDDKHTPSDIIILDDASDSDIEVIENTCFGTVDCSQLELANCESTSGIIERQFRSSHDPNNFMNQLYNFDVETVQSKQSDDPQKWLISDKDKNTNSIQRKKGPKCSRCKHYGHFASRCSEKPHAPSCSLCTSTQHQEPRCPEKVCRQCGNRGDYSTSYCYQCFKFRNVNCNVCNLPGHIAKYCPDLWRRYHLTINEGSLTIPNEQIMIPRNKQWCSGCAQQGHLEHECNDIHYHREFPPTRPDIVHYIDILNEINDETEERPRFSEPIRNRDQYSAPGVQRFPYLMNDPLTSKANSLLMLNRIMSENNLISNRLFEKLPNFVLNPFVFPNSQQNVTVPNLLNEMGTSFQNACYNQVNPHLLQQMSHNFQNKSASAQFIEPNIYNMKKISELILTKPFRTVQNFIRKQVNELDTVEYNPRVLRQKLYRFENHTNTMNVKKGNKHYWYRAINMFIFGINRLNDGQVHYNFIRKFLNAGDSRYFDDRERRSLMQSYAYIFGIDKHPNVNYQRLLKILIDRNRS